jgi:cellulose synthase/poly-beta-1,6-N-acetylglucosamine synthase-like glycosyltransferase
MLYLLLTLLFVAYHVYQWYKAKPYQKPESVDLNLEQAPIVSILVPAWNAAQDIAEFIDSFHALQYPNKELILCAGGSDGSLELARKKASSSILVLEQIKGEGKQKALAKSFARSHGEIIYLTDIDCRLDDESLARVLKPILDGKEAVVTGSSMPLVTQHTIGAVLIHWATVRKAAGLKPRYLDGVLGRNCAATRTAIKTINGFNFDAPTGTDYRMAQQLTKHGYKIWFEPTSEVQTEFAWPLGTYVRKRARWLRNVILYAERPRQLAELKGVVVNLAIPFALLFLFILSLILMHPLPAFLSALLILHGTLNRLRYVREMLPPRYLRLTLLPGSLENLFGTFAAGVYAATTLLSPKLRKQW